MFYVANRQKHVVIPQVQNFTPQCDTRSVAAPAASKVTVPAERTLIVAAPARKKVGTGDNASKALLMRLVTFFAAES